MLLPQPRPFFPSLSKDTVDFKDESSVLFRGPRGESTAFRAPSPLSDYDGVLLSSPSTSRSPLGARTPSPPLPAPAPDKEETQHSSASGFASSAPAMASDWASIFGNPLERFEQSRSPSRTTARFSIASSSEQGELIMSTYRKPASRLSLSTDQTSKPPAARSPIEALALSPVSRLSTPQSLFTGGSESRPVSAMRLHLESLSPVEERPGESSLNTRSPSPSQPPSPVYIPSLAPSPECYWGSSRDRRRRFGYDHPIPSILSPSPPLPPIYVPPTPKFFPAYSQPSVSGSPTPHPPAGLSPSPFIPQFTPTYQSHIPLPLPAHPSDLYSRKRNAADDSSMFRAPGGSSDYMPPSHDRWPTATQNPMWVPQACSFIPPVIPATPNTRDIYPIGCFPQVRSPWGQAPEMFPETVKRHERFFFDDGGFHIEVKNTSYRIHEHFIRQHAPSLWAPYSLRPRVTQIFGIEPYEFDLVLSLFYPKNLLQHEPQTLADWSAVLHVAHTCNMAQIQTLAISQLEKLASAAEKVELANKYGVREWLVPAYIELSLRMEGLSMTEEKKVGVEAAMMIASMKHQVEEGVRRFVDQARAPKMSSRSVDMPPWAVSKPWAFL